jgi:hypothetical protein
MYRHELTLVDSDTLGDGRQVSALEPGRLQQAKPAYTTRRIALFEAGTLVSGAVRPRAGDLVLARVTRVRQHARIELPTGRRAFLHEGDEVLVCYGNRYAPDQYEAVVPQDLGPCHLVAAGGVAARSLSRHASMKPPTEITPIGLVGDRAGRPINLGDWALPRLRAGRARPFTVAVVGTSMNAGKTTAAAHLIKGLVRAGLRVGAAKVTGTGAGGDYWFMYDSGASVVLDFTDAGFASTYRATLGELEDIFSTLTAHLGQTGVDAIVLEVADGLYQDETAALLKSAVFRCGVEGVLFAAGDAMGAAAGSRWLSERGLPVLGVSGALTASPLAIREAAQATGLPVLDLGQLADAGVAGRLGVAVGADAVAQAV